MDKALKLAAMIAAIGTLAACSTTGGSLCTAGPFIPDQGVNERWTRGEKEQLVTLNNSGEAICGWRAP